MKYPSLYDVTNKRSASYQKRYFFFLRLEYCILILNAVNAFLTYEKKTHSRISTVLHAYVNDGFKN